VSDGNIDDLHRTLNEVLAFLQKSEVELFDNNKSVNNSSLLSRCQQVVEKSRTPTTIRSIHHFACSGGTLLSKCIAAMPNTYLLSEVHPTSTITINNDSPEFRPTDMTSLSHYAGIPKIKALSETLFVSQIEVIQRHLENISSKLVLREHSHSDYCVGASYASQPVLVKLFEEHFRHKKLLTVRDPIDSFMSLTANGWLHFSPGTFDEYCKRFLAFISNFDSHEILKYEDFVADPKNSMIRVSDILEIDYNPDFEDFYDIFNVTGDSGRRSEAIKKRERREVSADLQKEIQNSPNYNEVKKTLQY
tara:strand:+ start:2374 stop:3288 length:915 start_codon:yes stop_codon:yes gene_type:complete